MSVVQKMAAGASNAGAAFGPSNGDEGVLDRFPAGLRVLVVDDDTTCLKILEQMLRKCEYNVTICSRATGALSLLRERKGHFDLVISDVHMPDMDGFRLLELVGLEMDLPVIMMSADSRTSMVMKGIKHGACDYLIKPVRFEELRNIWQHIVRKKRNDNKDHEQSGSLEESDRHRRGVDDVEHTSPANAAADSNWTTPKKKRDAKEDPDDGELENDDPSTSKKPRVVWSVELHQQFVSAVNQLGIDKAVPKRILELMNVPGLTRENVASHLQVVRIDLSNQVTEVKGTAPVGSKDGKYRLYLKRISGVAQHHGGLPSSFSGSVETNTRAVPLGRLDFQSLAASGQIPPQTLAALHAELLGRPSSSVVLPSLEQSIFHTSLQGPKCIPDECGLTFGQPLMKCRPGKQFPEPNVAVDNMSSGFGAWAPNHLMSMANTSVSGLANPQNGNMLVQMLQQQRQPPPPPPPQPVVAEASHAINVQPSCLIAPCQPSSTFQVGNNSIPIHQSSLLFSSQLPNNIQAGNILLNQHSSYSNPNIIVDPSPFPSQSNAVSSVGAGRVGGNDPKNVLTGYSIPVAVSSAAAPSCSVPSDGTTGWNVATSDLGSNPANKLSGFMPALCDVQSPGPKPLMLPDQGRGKNLGFVGKGTCCIPSRFAVDDMEPPSENPNQTVSSALDEGSKVKQEMYLDFIEGSIVGNPVLPHHHPSDFMSVLSK
ncbi:hypothetical protein Taro_051086 [Colocasia esculenta]|uniref:Two-component response regulator n=1 Tax=Colocasia esculenta TaxID=4460 RepID=A0A843XFU7_COLES|nr:hypothetical protein [Colocasia esculenta]